MRGRVWGLGFSVCGALGFRIYQGQKGFIRSVCIYVYGWTYKDTGLCVLWVYAFNGCKDKTMVSKHKNYTQALSKHGAPKMGGQKVSVPSV